MKKKSVTDVPVAGRRVLVRVDFNVPQDSNGAITDDTRMQAVLPTIRYLIEQGARIILVSHLGSPTGVDEKFRMTPVAARLSELIDRKVATVTATVGPEAEAAAAGLQDGELLLLENSRFQPEEEANDPEFARRLAALAELYVNDAFGAAHRAHASTEGVAHHLPAVAGLLMAREIDTLSAAVAHPQRPFVAVLGGAKVKDKLKVIENLLPQVDRLILGGGMAYTFLRAQGYSTGNSLVDPDYLAAAAEILARDAAGGDKIALPVDVVVTDDFKNPTLSETVNIDSIAADREGVDIGPRTVESFNAILDSARTVIWNGPMGVFEKPQFAAGTRAIAEKLTQITLAGATTIIGGGDSAAAVTRMGLAEGMTHISTGGGATLKFLEGRELPAVAAIQDA